MDVDAGITQPAPHTPLFTWSGQTVRDTADETAIALG